MEPRTPGHTPRKNPRSRVERPVSSRVRLNRPTRLRAPHDTGLSLATSLTRDQRLRRSRRTARLQASLVAIVVVAALIAGWQISRPDATESPSDTATQAPSTPEQVAVVVADRSDPTPFFGSYRSLHLYLPVSPDALTEIGYHQASGSAALSMTSLLPDADMVAAEENQGTGRPAAGGDEVGPTVLSGEVLRMWRSNRTGPPDTAIDVGAPPGTPVYAPVTGEVIGVRAYRLYDKYDDYEIHIQPTGWPEVDVVMIHVENVSVEVGDHVIGGVTSVAGVRLLSDRVTHQISAFTKDGGDHVHVQLNRLEVPGKLPPIGGS